MLEIFYKEVTGLKHAETKAVVMVTPDIIFESVCIF